MKRPQLSELTLNEKIAQLLMISQGKLLVTDRLDENRENVRRSYEEIDEIMEKYQYGSIWTGSGIVENNINQDGFDYTYSVKGTAQYGIIETYNRWLKKSPRRFVFPCLLLPTPRKVLAVSLVMVLVLLPHYAMKEEFEARGAKVKIEDKLVRTQHLKVISDESDLIIYAAYVAGHRPVGMTSLYNDAMKAYWFAFTIGREKTIGISLGYPYLHIDAMQGAGTFANLYSPSPDVQKALVSVLYGEIPFVGESPVDIEPKLRLVYG